MSLCGTHANAILHIYHIFFSFFSVAFSGMFYISLYIARSLKIFTQRHSRYPSIRLCVTIAPVVFAVLVAASRTADYHHHWQGKLNFQKNNMN